jgi:hypothetical protein
MNLKYRIATFVSVFALLATAERVLERVGRAQTKAPSYQVDPFWPKLPKQWILGQVSGLDVDANDHVWIIQRPWSLNSDGREKIGSGVLSEAPPVMEFDAASNYIQGWGGEGPGYEWPKDEHAIHRLQGQRLDLVGRRTAAAREDRKSDSEITKSGKFLMQVGHRGQSKGSLDTNNFNNAADIYVYPKTNEVFVADGYVNRRVIVLDADTGKFKRMWGAYGNTGRQRTQQAGGRGPGPQQFNTVHGVQVSDDGTVYMWPIG